MRCVVCGVDINRAGMENMSHIWGCPVCEACADSMTDKDWRKLEADAEVEE